MSAAGDSGRGGCIVEGPSAVVDKQPVRLKPEGEEEILVPVVVEVTHSAAAGHVVFEDRFAVTAMEHRDAGCDRDIRKGQLRFTRRR